jgi:hypothetical protein
LGIDWRIPKRIYDEINSFLRIDSVVQPALLSVAKALDARGVCFGTSRWANGMSAPIWSRCATSSDGTSTMSSLTLMSWTAL